MKIDRKKLYIISSVTMVKSSSIKGFPGFTVTDEQRVKATPKRKATRSNRVEGARESVNFVRFSA